ncbi:hamartin-like isoform X2 [Protopterus annectens]|uniref:hamartin-like isoform X2 n=1 Tax=Protopterus annectens TaxID=7888 RepID=UPI001CF99F8C|nr:hamartin-like isoform X2 [Protopterus annectens]
MIPQAGKQYLHEFFDIFGRLSTWYLKNPGHVPEVYMVYLQVSVYALFHRLYGMYPCNFVSYLRSHYSMKENHETFEEVVKPMLEHVRIHPELVTGTKDHELDPTRWKRLETHDIVIECAKVSLDPKESSCEEGYTTMPEHFCTHLQHRQLDPSASPFTDSQSNYGSISSTPFSTPKVPVTQFSGPQSLRKSPHTSQPLAESQQDAYWSPAVQCGMCTPPPMCSGVSPTNIPSDLSQSASYISSKATTSTPSGKETPSGTPATSPPPSSSDEYEHISMPHTVTTPSKKDGKTGSSRPSLARQNNITHRDKGTEPADSENAKTVSLQDLPKVIEGFHLQQSSIEKEEAAITEELSEITTERGTTLLRGGFDSPFNRTTETLTGCQKKYCHPQAAQCLNRQSYHTEYSSPCTPDKLGSSGTRNTPSQERCAPKRTFTPIEMPSNCSPAGIRTEQDSLEISVITPSPHKVSPRENSGLESTHSEPFSYLFDLALPKTASHFIRQKTEELLKKKKECVEGEGETSSYSPLEVLDKLIQQGADAYMKELSRLSLPNTSADWTHFGGSAPVDELHTLRNQLVMLQNLLQYERYKREQHAVRNRRLLRKIIHATALEEQNTAMKDQLKLQELDIHSLKCCLQREQFQCQRQQEEHVKVLSKLHSQIKQLHYERDQLQSRNRQLETKLQECQQTTGDLKIELQKAKNKISNTEYMLNQLRQKLSTSESVQQHMDFLTKQLLILGEVNEIYMEKLQHCNADTSKEVQMLHDTHLKEQEKQKLCILQQNQRLDSAQKRIAELESQLTKKEHLLLEQKKFLEDVKSQARVQLKAAEDRYLAQKHITQRFESHILDLYSQLEKKVLAEHPPSTSKDRSEVAKQTPERSEKVKGSKVNSRNLDDTSAGQTKPTKGPTFNPQSSGTISKVPSRDTARSTAESVNSSREVPFLGEPSINLPMTCGSCPSSKSFLGMRARELFRNKSESQCDEESVTISGLSDTLKTDLCRETGSRADVVPPSRADKHQNEASSQENHVSKLRIMDYNETQQDHN